jgi:DNA-binding MarR family transcriptional regulator
MDGNGSPRRTLPTSGQAMPTEIPLAELSAPELAARLRLTIARLSRGLRSAASDEQDLTLSRLSALSWIEQLGPITIGDLAAAERVTAASMTRIVDVLEQQDLARRASDPTDGRIVLVELTDGGRAVLDRSRTRRTLVLTPIVAALSDEERGKLAEGLALLERMLEHP